MARYKHSVTGRVRGTCRALFFGRSKVAEKIEVIPDGQAFAVKVTYSDGRTDVRHGFATREDAAAWIANYWAAKAAASTAGPGNEAGRMLRDDPLASAEWPVWPLSRDGGRR